MMEKTLLILQIKLVQKNMDDMDESEKVAQLHATYVLDASVYVSKEIYGTPLTRTFGYGNNSYTKNLPLIAYGYEYQYGQKTGCGRDVNFIFSFDYDCSLIDFADVKISEKIVKRCAPSMNEQRDECEANPLDSRCHGGIDNEQDKNFKVHYLKAKFLVFNADENQTIYEADKNRIIYNIALRDFVNGSATKGNNIYFNFVRSVNYPTNPKVVNINDFNGEKILQRDFVKNNKTFIPGIESNKTQPSNNFARVEEDKAVGNNAHFYYGYVNSTSREYYICGKANRTDRL